MSTSQYTPDVNITRGRNEFMAMIEFCEFPHVEQPDLQEVGRAWAKMEIKSVWANELPAPKTVKVSFATRAALVFAAILGV